MPLHRITGFVWVLEKLLLGGKFCIALSVTPGGGVDARVASPIQAAHWLPVPKQVVAVARLHDCARRRGEVFPQALRQVL